MGQIVSSGTLPDSDIVNLCNQGILISENFEPQNIKQACYELRASNIYYDLNDNNKRYVLDDDKYILIKPKQLIVVITKEVLAVPNDILGRILTKGKLFSIGLLPVNTYADPGFFGQLGIVLFNLSNDYLKIYPEESIAKIEFSKLIIPVSTPYRGQHGYQTKIWPIPNEMILSEDERIKDSRIKSPVDEVAITHGPYMGIVLKRIFKFERYLLLAASLYLLLSLLLIYALQKTDWISPMVAIILGVGSNIITSLLFYFATNLRRK